ncbi:hypothetical protein F442_05134 [Phytophthora nicotianae P10297]|uniref:Uncharacterized protein n=4 Tax=Phytophthora nicotianae TaxID=4792 RepID=V9FJJ7_PHYNI|nr:hypothetical protein F443_05070 [Phytophthora nicotianae P1569]ETL98083.1 hypothetical protein L917_04785 [Phytophthora nicotianae]ETO80383.1 hypothetical protein F444_05117 [Phytophthora nicotianae P1976]ETP49331.1 hypothetical protein F442_05134 [Phytophthora nicotianae P10297]
MREKPLVAVESIESSALSNTLFELVSVSVLVVVPVSVILAPPVVTVSPVFVMVTPPATLSPPAAMVVSPDASTENFGDPPATLALINENPVVKVLVSKLSSAPENIPVVAVFLTVSVSAVVPVS